MPIPLRGAPLAQSSRVCQNYDCNNSETNAKMRSCAKCSLSYYCSKACQKVDWPRHKPGCIMTAESRDYLRSSGLSYKGYTPVEVDKMMKKWTQVYRPLLSSSGIQALASKPNEYLWKTHALCIYLEPTFTNPNIVRLKDIARGFTINKVFVVPFEEAFRVFDNATNPEVNQEGMEIYLTEREVYKYSTLLLLFVVPMKIVRVIPNGYLEMNIMDAPKMRDWEGYLRRIVRNGIVM
ncbi:hypothetical protein BDQ17DRAFT_1358692 [Cyathus striatus]|nr:hypothetical protein BDQ17DRAFT_1358692 [Cyathus striatus]